MIYHRLLYIFAVYHQSEKNSIKRIKFNKINLEKL